MTVHDRIRGRVFAFDNGCKTVGTLSITAHTHRERERAREQKEKENERKRIIVCRLID
jgi:hypothetical protein